MGMMNCKECNGSISSKADKCPLCGAPTSAGTQQALANLFVWVIMMAGVAFLLYVLRDDVARIFEKMVR